MDKRLISKEADWPSWNYQEPSYQKSFIELKWARKLPGELVNTVKPLKKDWTSLVFIVILPVTTSISKTMTELQPLTSHQYLETLTGKNDENTWYENSCMESKTLVGFSRKEAYFYNKTRNSVLNVEVIYNSSKIF